MPTSRSPQLLCTLCYLMLPRDGLNLPSTTQNRGTHQKPYIYSRFHNFELFSHLKARVGPHSPLPVHVAPSCIYIPMYGAPHPLQAFFLAIVPQSPQ
ncbi:hypothetical protein BDP55DRAFT_641402 [Colletotrichum godetiae]|uniref:Uncharacterized protein n=1 Tax=Colletotrichum godetiae TaxID=1209918 RepID=A0AAJ0EZK7_9PEZI|nr:uncharacterized protein BDP55DRAFT_641402 [Colletotrichum godetiae]KAK1701384.1 hypothetical protein BDP55DRAFT_641402 [Colletotrichum godetiae]